MTRSVLVTGGNRGIGLAIVRAFVAQGDTVAATYRTGVPPTGDSGDTGVPDGVLWVRCDVTSSEEVDDAFAQAEAAHGPVEIAVANAGMTRDQLVLRMPDVDFMDVLDTNLTGAFRVARRGAKSMLRLRRGRLIFVSSVSASAAAPARSTTPPRKPDSWAWRALSRARWARAASPPTWSPQVSSTPT